ncbi:hypothetical protein [Methylobacterium sp. D48H]
MKQVVKRLAVLLRLAAPAPTPSWRDARPVLVGAPLVLGAPLSRGEAP